MRDPTHPAFAAAKALNDALGSQAAVPHNAPFSQLIWATFVRSKRTYEAIGHLLGYEFDTQAAMLCRPLFEDMIVAHWLELNRADSQWLVDRFLRHREAMALDQLFVEERHGFGTGPLLVPDSSELRAKQNELGRAFKGRARRDWWDPGKDGKGSGSPIGVEGVAAILEDVAARHERFAPRFAGGQEPMLRKLEAVIVNWFSRQLHHTAMGLPFQPMDSGPIREHHDPLGSFRTLFTSYWTFGQQGFLLLEHLGHDARAYEEVFLSGLRTLGLSIAPAEVLDQAPFRTYRPPA